MILRILIAGLIGVFAFNSNAQNNISIELVNKDFGIWAYQQHNDICKLINAGIKSGKINTYNAKNLKEPTQESWSKLMIASTVFLQTDPLNETVGKDTVIKNELSENFYLYKISGDYILLKPSKKSNNLLKLKKSEFLSLLNEEQQAYFKDYTSNFALCIDSIPTISKRLFDAYLIKIFEYSKKPEVNLFINDSLKSIWPLDEKENMSKEQVVIFVATDPEDMTIGYDSVLLLDYNLKDTSKDYTIILMVNLENLKLEVNTISCGLERMLLGNYMKFTIPFGYLPYIVNAPYSSTEIACLNAILQIKLIDTINENANNENLYDDFFNFN